MNLSCGQKISVKIIAFVYHSSTLNIGSRVEK